MEQKTLMIRKSKAADVEDLLEIEKLAWNDENTPTVIHWKSDKDFLEANPEGSQLVAVLGEKVCGYAGYRSPTGLTTNQHVVELYIAVHPQYQGLGAGRALLEELEQQAASEGLKKLSLRVMATNKTALHFYTRCGFIEQGRLVKEFKINDVYVDDILMYKFV